MKLFYLFFIIYMLNFSNSIITENFIKSYTNLIHKTSNSTKLFKSIPKFSISISNDNRFIKFMNNFPMKSKLSSLSSNILYYINSKLSKEKI